MTPAEANREAKAQQLAAHFVALLEKNGADTHSAKMLDAFDAMLASDSAQLRCWTWAKCVHAPSAATWARAREVLRERLPELSVAEQFRDQLQELEATRQAAAGEVADPHDDAFDRHTDDLIAESRGL